MDLDEVQVDSLVPKPLARGEYTSRFLAELRALRRRHGGAGRARGRRAARCCATSARSRRAAPAPALKEFPRHHPVASAKGSDNIIAFTTKRYARTPLVVQGRAPAPTSRRWASSRTS